jgi:outer membrane protein
MKKVLLLLFLVASTSLMAQTGYVRSQALLYAMPESATANKTLGELSARLEAEIAKAENNAQVKFKSLQYKASDPELGEAIRADLESQAATLQNELARVKQNAQQQLQAEEAKLMEPISAKLTAAIEKVAKAKGFNLIVDISTVSYAAEGLDITLEVSKDLGIAPKED